MFKNLKKWAAVSLTAVMFCTMMAPQIAFAEEAKGEEVVDDAERKKRHLKM